MPLCYNFVFLYANFISMATTSVSRKLKELDNLRDDIKATAGLKDKTLSPNDFDFIETDIKKKLPKSSINAKTLKRLFGYDKTGESSYIRLYTLDVLSKYVGFDNWSAYLERVRLSEGSGSGNFTGNQINDVCGWQEWRDYRPMTMLYYLLKLKIVFYHILLNIFAEIRIFVQNDTKI